MGKVVKIKKQAELSQAAFDKIESSGLTEEQAVTLGMYDVTIATTLDEQFDGHPALVIPYYDLSGKPLKAHPAWPEFYRIRYLNKSFSFKNAAGEKISRYSQPRDTGVCAYFPQLTNWTYIAGDYKEPVLITEGELKAAKATADGFPTIGLGGVYNFRSTKQALFFLPELEAFVWQRRTVHIVYDSDYQTNTNICHAINTLADELAERGALVHVVTLENVYDDKERKTGLDDYLVERGSEAFQKLLEAAEPLGVTKRLWQMNDEVVYVEDPGFVIAQASGQKLPVANFQGHSRWATANVPERKVTAQGKISYAKVSAAKAWVSWPLRRWVDKITYMPGREKFYEEKGRSYYNAWKGWGVEPVKGDVKPFLKLFDFIFEGASPEEKQWALDWMGYPISHPGSKLFSAIIVHGRTTGTGKTFIGYTLARIYGENFIKIKNENLFDTWWAENRQFVLGDEISGTDKRAEADAMKTMITQEEININVKYIPQFSIPDCVNYYLTSNHGDALFLEDEDRRFYVHEVMHSEALPDSFYADYEKWLNNGGAAALMHWFLQRDYSKFNPKGKAPRTAARERMIISSKSDLDSWCRELKENPNGILRVGQLRHTKDMFTSRELLEIYQRDHDSAGKVTANGLGRALGRAGFKQAYGGMPVETPDGKQGRYFIIRNQERWLKVKDKKTLAKNIASQPVRD